MSPLMKVYIRAWKIFIAVCILGLMLTVAWGVNLSKKNPNRNEISRGQFSYTAVQLNRYGEDILGEFNAIVDSVETHHKMNELELRKMMFGYEMLWDEMRMQIGIIRLDRTNYTSTPLRTRQEIHNYLLGFLKYGGG